MVAALIGLLVVLRRRGKSGPIPAVGDAGATPIPPVGPGATPIPPVDDAGTAPIPPAPVPPASPAGDVTEPLGDADHDDPTPGGAAAT